MAKRPPRTAERPNGANPAAGDAGPRRTSLREAVLAHLDANERADLISLQGQAYMIYALMSPGPRDRQYLELCNKGWAQLQAQLAAGRSIATGRDPQDLFGPRRTIPADRWPYATVNYETWAVHIQDMRIVEVEVSSVGGLHISKKSRQARLGAADLDLRGRSFDVLVTLAEGARQGRPMESINSLNKEHIKGNAGPKALGRIVFNIRRALVKAGMTPTASKALVQNVPNEGYRLVMPVTEVSIEQ